MGKPIKWGATSVKLLIDLGITNIVTSPPPQSPPSGLIISTQTDIEELPVIYEGSAGEIEGIATIGIFVQPSTAKCRLRETEIPGMYALYLRDERYAVDNGASPPVLARTLVINFSGADGLPTTGVSYEIDLVRYDPYEEPITLAEIAAEVLKLDWETLSGEPERCLLNAARFLRNKWDVAGGTLTVKKEDDTTTAWTAAVTSDAAAEPIIGSDPA